MTDIVFSESVEFVDSLSSEISSGSGSSLTSTATTGELVTSRTTIMVSDGATTGDRASGGGEADFADTMTTGDSVVGARIAPVSDPATAGDLVTASAHITVSISDGATTGDSVVPSLSISVTDGATSGDAVIGARVASISDGATTGDSSLGLRHVTASVSDGAATGDIDGSVFADAESDDATTGDSITATRIATGLVDDAAATGETVVSGATVLAEIEDSAVTGDLVTTQTFASVTISDGADTGEMVHTSADLTGNFWNNGKGAAAVWSGLPFNSMVCIDGRVYGAGPAGIYLMDDAVDDNGTKIAFEVLWDLSNWGSPQKKRFAGVYVDGSCVTPFTVRVVNEDGSREYKTRLPAKKGSALQHRAEPGRGLASVYYRVGIKQTKAFAVDRVLVEHEQIARRVT